MGDERQVFVPLLLEAPQLGDVAKHDDRQRDADRSRLSRSCRSTRHDAARRAMEHQEPRSPRSARPAGRAEWERFA